ncbi:MAG TPA: hypothetical protein PLA74_00730 [Syntrophales bacterium]|nr:hypothetical protein [Syntrophales bacterium]HPQ44854.1 hypothetical protein [Syntrophales bacterium]
MRSILDVFSKTWFINVILAGCVAFFGAKSIGVWVAEDKMQTVQAVPEKIKKWPVKKVARNTIPPETAYGAVTDKDLFNENRIEFVEEAQAEAGAEAEAGVEPVPVKEDIRVSGRKIVLYGIIIRDDYKTALISNPKPPSSQRPSMWVREGDTIGEAKEDVVVHSIKKESITLRDGGKMYEVLLYDKDKPRGKVAAKEESKPTVVTTEPTVETKKPAVRKPPQATVDRMPEPGAQPANNTALSAPPGFETDRNRSQKDSTYRSVNTPFGKIKVREK